jgi:hypothetical protein
MVLSLICPAYARYRLIISLCPDPYGRPEPKFR